MTRILFKVRSIQAAKLPVLFHLNGRPLSVSVILWVQLWATSYSPTPYVQYHWRDRLNFSIRDVEEVEHCRKSHLSVLPSPLKTGGLRNGKPPVASEEILDFCLKPAIFLTYSSRRLAECKLYKPISDFLWQILPQVDNRLYCHIYLLSFLIVKQCRHLVPQTWDPRHTRRCRGKYIVMTFFISLRLSSPCRRYTSLCSCLLQEHWASVRQVCSERFRWLLTV